MIGVEMCYHVQLQVCLVKAYAYIVIIVKNCHLMECKMNYSV